ncbi:hypothetical protein AVEN_225779-1 [Araneus ventricosus]|uniref:Uncharacterized protein n=1 Tax=Araneus ventricosus TaxID=182803 RepID=A0A4Y2BCM4_ARAVE|nr:hypothetical protein AVEN_225779-1 [Araneus ventricosus]
MATLRMLRHRWATSHYRQSLFEIVIVGCSLSENGTFGRPEAVFGDNETGYQTTGLMATLRMLRHRWATSHYRQSLFEIVIVGCSLSENGTFGLPKLCLGTTRQATKNGTYGHITHAPSSLGY